MTDGILGEVEWPSDWQAIPFGRLADRRRDVGQSTLPPLSVFLDEGVVPRSSREDNYNRLGADLAQYLVVEPGDLVFNKLRTWQGGIGVSEYAGIVSPAYFVCRPRHALFPKFAHYALRSTVYLQELTRVSKWMPPAQFDIAWEDLRDVVIRVPSFERQRAIADYLDEETRRIDIALDLRRRTITLLDEATNTVLDAAFASATTQRTKLKHLLAQSPCYGVLVPNFVEVGVPFVRVGDLASMEAEETPARYISESQSREYSRTRLALGDILLSVVGSIDKVRVVSPALVDSNIARAVCRLVPKAGVPSDLLALWFRTTAYLDQARQATSNDTAQPTLGMGDLAGFELWFPEPGDYGEFRARLQHRLGTLAAARHRLQLQIDLMAERRQALVTHAVTGQLEISGVAA